MERKVGTQVRGIRCPIIKEGDDLSSIVVSSILEASESEGFKLKDKDVIAITESIVARAQGNYATVDNVAEDLKNKFKCDEIGVIFPIFSRNRFAIILRGIARAFSKIYLMLSYPSDEVGNSLITIDDLDDKNIDPYKDILTEGKYRELFGYKTHQFTGVDYISYYKELCKEENCQCEIIFANKAVSILNYTKNILCADIHSRFRSKRLLKSNGANIVLGLDDILTSSINGSGFNKDYGLLGSNKATEEKIKLFPRDAEKLVNDIQYKFKKLNVNLEVMVYGDGAFKDPVGKIWELADPIVSPFHTKGLEGTPNELKLKYLADNDFKDLSSADIGSAIVERIKNKDKNLKGKMETQGTTPRQITDLLGSLCDLTSGSGDKGTPVILVQGYFDNLASE